MASQHASDEQHHTDAASDKHSDSLAHTKDEEDVVSNRGAHEAKPRDTLEKTQSSASAGPGPPPVCHEVKLLFVDNS